MLSGTTIQKGSETTLTQKNTYNGGGQRVGKTENGTATNYFYQDGSVLYTTDSSGAKTTQNFLTTAGSTMATARYTASDISYYTYNKDIRNSTVSILDETGAVATKYAYDEFGQTTVDGDYTFSNEICYTGGIYDWSTGQYYLNARYYDPQTGRFLSEDTYRGDVNEPNSLHLYAYCANNPINYVDPSGHTAFTTWSKTNKTLIRNYFKKGASYWSKVSETSRVAVQKGTTITSTVSADFGISVEKISLKVGLNASISYTQTATTYLDVKKSRPEKYVKAFLFADAYRWTIKRTISYYAPFVGIYNKTTKTGYLYRVIKSTVSAELRYSNTKY